MVELELCPEGCRRAQMPGRPTVQVIAAVYDAAEDTVRGRRVLLLGLVTSTGVLCLAYVPYLLCRYEMPQPRRLSMHLRASNSVVGTRIERAASSWSSPQTTYPSIQPSKPPRPSSIQNRCLQPTSATRWWICCGAAAPDPPAVRAFPAILAILAVAVLANSA